jgi:hypothetical protein
VSFAAITLSVASQRVFIVVVVIYFVMTQSGNFWTHPCTNTLFHRDNSEIFRYFPRIYRITRPSNLELIGI